MVRRIANLVINLNNVMYGGDRASTLESYMDCYVLDVKTLKVHKYSYDEVHEGLKNGILELENMFFDEDYDEIYTSEDWDDFADLSAGVYALGDDITIDCNYSNTGNNGNILTICGRQYAFYIDITDRDEGEYSIMCKIDEAEAIPLVFVRDIETFECAFLQCNGVAYVYKKGSYFFARYVIYDSNCDVTQLLFVFDRDGNLVYISPEYSANNADFNIRVEIDYSLETKLAVMYGDNPMPY